MKSNRSVIGLAFIAVFSVVVLSGCAKGLKLGAMAPDFALKDLNGRDVRLSQFRGNVVMLTFTAVDCRYCREEAPHLRDLQKAYSGKKFQVLAVNGWNEPREKVRDYAAKTGLNYPYLLGGQATATEYGVEGLPTAYLLDREGKVVQKHEGWEPGDEKRLATEIDAALR
jgi:peroxiredoxin